MITGFGKPRRGSSFLAIALLAIIGCAALTDAKILIARRTRSTPTRKPSCPRAATSTTRDGSSTRSI